MGSGTVPPSLAPFSGQLLLQLFLSPVLPILQTLIPIAVASVRQGHGGERCLRGQGWGSRIKVCWLPRVEDVRGRKEMRVTSSFWLGQQGLVVITLQWGHRTESSPQREGAELMPQACPKHRLHPRPQVG
jgi:hypothetical protein